MTDLYQFMSDSPWLSFFLAWLVTQIVGGLLTFVLRLWCRTLRTLNIRKHGWPPEHLDADGDFRPLAKAEDAA